MTAISFLVIGAGFFITPVSWAESVEIALTTPTARTDLRATYGGFDFMFGVFLLLCSTRPAWYSAGLMAAVLCLGGFAGGRIAGYVIEGSISTFMLVLLGVELMAISICGYLYHRRPRDTA
jgi:hypothetical protein